MEDFWLEDRYDSLWEMDDAEEFERNQLALDREWDEEYDGDEDEMEPDGYWDETTEIFTPDGLEPPF